MSVLKENLSANIDRHIIRNVEAEADKTGASLNLTIEKALILGLRALKLKRKG